MLHYTKEKLIFSFLFLFLCVSVQGFGRREGEMRREKKEAIDFIRVRRIHAGTFVCA